MDSSQYMKKCLNMLNNDNFMKLTDHRTKSIEGKIQGAIRKIKCKLNKMNTIKFIRQVLHQVNCMEQQNFAKWQKMTILITFLYDQSIQTLVQHLII